MRRNVLKILAIFNICIFSIITSLVVIMHFRSSYAVPSTTWDGTVASSFSGGNGTSSNPYQISNGAQLAYFINLLNNYSSYRSKSYIITSDIYLNDGYFEFKNKDEYFYYKDYTRYFINEDKYYNSPIFNSKNEVGSFNQLPISNFEFTGNFDGGNHFIYGLFQYSDVRNEYSGFFKKISNSSTVKNIKLINNFINANSVRLGFITSCENSELNNIVFRGTIINTGLLASGNVSSQNISNNTITINDTSSNNYLIVLKGYSNLPFSYDGVSYDSGFFELPFINNSSTSITVTLESSRNLTLTNVKYYKYSENYSGFVGETKNSNFSNVGVSGNIFTYDGEVGGIVSRIEGNVVFKRCYNNASLTGYVVGGIGCYADSSNVELHNVYNTGSFHYSYEEINHYSFGGFFYGQFNSSIYVYNCFNNSTSECQAQNSQAQYIVNNINSYFYSYSQNYYTMAGLVIGNDHGYSSLENVSYLPASKLTAAKLESMGYLKYESGSSNVDKVWKLQAGSPYLYFDDGTKPMVIISIKNVAGYNYSWSNSNNSRNISVVDFRNLGQTKAFNITGVDSNEIAFIEYFINDKYTTTKLGMDFENSLVYDYSGIDITNNTCSTLYARVTDIYGNVNYAFSNLLFMREFKGTTTFDVQTGSNDVEDFVLSDTTFNARFRNSYSKDSSMSFPYGSDDKLYLKLVNKLPIGTIICLYDYYDDILYRHIVNNNSIYTNYIDSTNNSYYLFDLSNFDNVFEDDPGSYKYDNRMIRYISGNNYEFDIMISFDFPDTLEGNTYNFSSDNMYSSLVNYNPSLGDVDESYKIENVVGASDYYNVTNYSLNHTDSVSSMTATNNTTYSFNYNFKEEKDTVEYQDYTYTVSDKKFGYKKFKLNVEIQDRNGDSLSSLVGNNFEVKFKKGSYTKTFNAKSNSIASIEFEPDWDLNNNSLRQYNFQLDFKVINNNFRNILPGNYKVVVSVVSQDGVVASDVRTIYINNPVAFSGYSFISSVDNSKRIIHSSKSNHTLVYNYRYSLYYGNSNIIMLKLYKYDDDSNLGKTSINPFTVFSSNNISNIGSGYYKLGSYACSKDVNCSFTFNFVDNPPQGNYLAEIYLRNSGVIISRDHFNFIIK